MYQHGLQCGRWRMPLQTGAKSPSTAFIRNLWSSAFGKLPGLFQRGHNHIGREGRNIFVSMEQAVGKLSVFFHVGNVHGQNAADFTRNHIALRDRALSFKLFEELPAVLGAMPFEFDRHDDRQFPVETLWVNNGHNPLNCTDILEPCDAS